MTPAACKKTLESGVMKPQAAPRIPRRTSKNRRLPGNSGNPGTEAREIANLCPAGAALGESAVWASWGSGLANTRFQSAKDAGLRAEDVPRLKLKWAFPDTSTMRSQPAVYRGRVFAGGQGSTVYALDMLTGCVLVNHVPVPVRSGIMVGEVGGNPALFFGDSAGKQLWKRRADPHPASTMTATPVSCMSGRPPRESVGFSRLAVLHVQAASRLWMPPPEKSCGKPTLSAKRPRRGRRLGKAPQPGVLRASASGLRRCSMPSVTHHALPATITPIRRPR